MKRLIFTAVILAGFLVVAAAPSMAITPPSDEEAQWLRTAPDLQERIDNCDRLLEPLLNPSANPLAVVDKFAEGIARNFGKTAGEKGYLERYDKNSDAVIDERDFLEMALESELIMREANSSPREGEAWCAVIPIKFPDQEPDPAHDQPYWENMFFGEDFNTTRSYYIQVSDDRLFISGSLLTNPESPDGWWVADFERSTYDFDSENDLLGEILDKVDPYYDFSQFDADGNTEADGVYFLYAGENTGWGSFYWGWATYGNYIVDGVRIGPLMFAGEYLMTWRVAAHEFGHMMGLPDLYDYQFDAWGVGNWAMMGKGSVYMCPWSRMKLGWADVIEIAIDRPQEEIFPQSLNSPVYRLWTEGQGGTQYFMVSFGKKEGYDQNLPGEGLLIWHIDDTVPNNNNENHKKVDLEEADGLDNMDKYENAGDDTDPYYDPNNTTFDENSYPNSKDYNGNPTKVEVVNISAVGDSMFADLKVGISGDIPVEETEPNNVWDDSGVLDIIPPNEVRDGKVDFYGDPSDFWRFTVPGPSVIKADLTVYSDINLSLFFWKEGGVEPVMSSESTQPGEHLEIAVSEAGNYYLEVRAPAKAAYYDISATYTLLPPSGKVDVYGTDLLPVVGYANTKTIPAMRLSLLKGGAGIAALNQLQVHLTGNAHYAANTAKLWLDDGDVTFGPGNDKLLSSVLFDPDTSTAKFTGMALELDADTELFVTIDLDEVIGSGFGATIGLRMFAYKDLSITGALVEYHNFPLSTIQSFVFNPPMPLCYVAAGDFTMGTDPANDPYYDPSCDLNQETPVHTNNTGDYYIGRYEITNAQYAQFMADGGYDDPAYWVAGGWSWKENNGITAPNGWNEGEYPIGDDYPDYPVAGVSWYEAMAFANWFGGRLPHEAEWEKSGRGTDARIYTYGNIYDPTKYHGTFPPAEVGSYPASDSLYGVADLEGNIFEWVADGWEWGLYQRYASGNLDPPTGSFYKLQRGYGWLLAGDCDQDYASRLSYRDTWPRTYRWVITGFRVVFDPP